MRKRSKYKVCGRLGYNAMMRIWHGKKRKWEKAKVFRQTNERNQRRGGSQVRNPGRSVENEDRRTGKRERSGKKGVVRMKDQHRSILMRRKGRQRRYGGVTVGKVRDEREKQRRQYKEERNQEDRRGRHGEKRGQKESRLSRVETRVDRRRWRSGRVPTLEMAQDLIEHGKIKRLMENGDKEKKVKWQGKRRNPGEGREIEEKTWKVRKRKGLGRARREENEKQAGKYMEVDFITGTRYLHRNPKSGEVVIPKGRKLSRRRGN